MFHFGRGITKTLLNVGVNTLRTNIFVKEVQHTFVRSIFGGFGGMGGNMGCRGNPVDSKYYDLLEVKPDATTDEIKQAFRKQAMKYHPDRGGNIEKFKEVKEAYDVLADEEKRQIYDQLGPDGLQSTGDASGFSGYADLSDIFESIFGEGEGFSQRRTRTDDMVQRLPLTLDELYTGVKKEFAVNRNKLCPDCKGVGTTKPNAVHKCPRCNGKGFILQTTMMMGMMAQSRVPCPECGGEGSSISSKDKCKTCRGKKVRREREEMSVTIKPGMDHGQKVMLRGAADQDPHLEAGDIVFYIDQIVHPVFRRRGSDLFARANISLLQSLTGAEVVMQHLNGEKVTLKSQEGDLLAPSSVRCVDDLGMPVYNQEGKFGKLYVQFNVQYPKELSKEQIYALKMALGDVKVEAKPEVKSEAKTEVKTAETKTETKSEAKPAEKKDKEDEGKPVEATYEMHMCDQALYGNKKLWDALFQ